MTVKSIHSPFHGRSVKFGRRRPADLGPHAELRSYLDTKALPPPPATCDYSTAAKRSLNNVYLNDQLGDCVIAGGAHVRGVTSGGAGDLVTFSKEEIIKTASAGLLQPALGRGQRHPGSSWKTLEPPSSTSTRCRQGWARTTSGSTAASRASLASSPSSASVPRSCSCNTTTSSAPPATTRPRSNRWKRLSRAPSCGVEPSRRKRARAFGLD